MDPKIHTITVLPKQTQKKFNIDPTTLHFFVFFYNKFPYSIQYFPQWLFAPKRACPSNK